MPARRRERNRATGESKLVRLQTDHRVQPREVLGDPLHEAGPPQVNVMCGNGVQGDAAVVLPGDAELRVGRAKFLSSSTPRWSSSIMGSRPSSPMTTTCALDSCPAGPGPAAIVSHPGARARPVSGRAEPAGPAGPVHHRVYGTGESSSLRRTPPAAAV